MWMQGVSRHKGYCVSKGALLFMRVRMELAFGRVGIPYSQKL